MSFNIIFVTFKLLPVRHRALNLGVKTLCCELLEHCLSKTFFRFGKHDFAVQFEKRYSKYPPPRHTFWSWDGSWLEQKSGFAKELERERGEADMCISFPPESWVQLCGWEWGSCNPTLPVEKMLCQDFFLCEVK